jgi:putative hydrolase of the HAD superfamily
MRRAQRILAVTFDVGGTLIEPWPSVGHIYAEVAAQHGVPGLAPEILNHRFAAAWKARPGFDHSIEGWSAIVDETFGGLVPEKPSQTFFGELYQRFTRASAWRIYDDVLATLNTLRERGLRVGVISNWDQRLRPLLDALGLAGQFEVTVVSCEIGASKPSPAPFQAAAKAFKLQPDGILHVGDSTEMDVAGARAAGFQAVQIVRGDGAGGNDRIKSLGELAVWISQAEVAR